MSTNLPKNVLVIEQQVMNIEESIFRTASENRHLFVSTDDTLGGKKNLENVEYLY